MAVVVMMIIVIIVPAVVTVGEQENHAGGGAKADECIHGEVWMGGCPGIGALISLINRAGIASRSGQ